MIRKGLVKRALAGGLLVGFATVALASFAGAATQPSTTYVDKQGGYRITIPTKWETIPRSATQIKQMIATLKKKKTTVDLADAYASILASQAGRTGLTGYVFQAFDWPQSPDTPIFTEVSVGITKLEESTHGQGSARDRRDLRERARRRTRARRSGCRRS